jgi:O-acetyl-ADP-ribose deacetylase (regulator of RNase III)
MIHEINVNLLEYPLDGIIHQANCFCCQGAGIAARIKSKFPEAYEADCKTIKGDRNKLGTFSVAVLPSNFHIYNMYSQYDMGVEHKQTLYDAVDNGLRLIQKHARENGLQTLGLPKNMGCVLGGGQWPVVRAIIECVFFDSPLDLYICNYQG